MTTNDLILATFALLLLPMSLTSVAILLHSVALRRRLSQNQRKVDRFILPRFRCGQPIGKAHLNEHLGKGYHPSLALIRSAIESDNPLTLDILKVSLDCEVAETITSDFKSRLLMNLGVPLGFIGTAVGLVMVLGNFDIGSNNSETLQNFSTAIFTTIGGLLTLIPSVLTLMGVLGPLEKSLIIHGGRVIVEILRRQQSPATTLPSPEKLREPWGAKIKRTVEAKP